ncbi:disease resistance protein RUN1-like [Lotus japonicus]|uniref:disease resistance protein RUN1-like n=1 Tax=Lotus japonicus TaxID=34305 RepID=UPI00258BC255|nr:disease resistance protein RUN1-like [Lotus japonicus]
MAKQAAPSLSSNFKFQWTYDVFLSFRGEDTRLNFTSHLYHSLRRKGIHTFYDEDGLKRGEEITPALLNAIQESRIAIIVFSKNYASSTFCLDELVKILESLNVHSRLVWPIFYDVDPSEVRHQTGVYAEAMVKHEERFQDDREKVQKWRKALCQAANLSGWHFQLGSEPEYMFIYNIVEEVSKKINRTPLHVVDNPVGLDSAVLEVRSLLGDGSEVVMVGIYGFGGIGKTTIARAVYNLIADQFEGSCFLADIRESTISKHGLVQLQEMLLSEILGEKDIKVGNVNQGIPIIKRRLQQMKVLLVLDDVDKLAQLKSLAGGYDWFGFGSKIIITTRDKQLLAAHGVVKLLDVKPLCDEIALELFSWHAFKSNKVDTSCLGISSRAVSYACGLPLALEVIGSYLFGKSLDECKSALDKYERIPHKEIHEILKVSYDGLGEDEKGIFLDIACFFNKYEIDYVKQVLQARGFHVEDGIRVLTDRSLIKIDAIGVLRMHDLVQDMGREIVRQESTNKPGRRSRLWLDKDIIHVLEDNMGTDKVEFIKFDMHNNNEVEWGGNAFEKMKSLRVLIMENAASCTGPKDLPNSLRVLDWRYYPSPSLPSDFNPKQLVILNMSKSCLKLFQPPKMLESLSSINFDGCEFLTELPNLSAAPFLMNLSLDNCTSLVTIHESVGFLENLRSLSAKGCTQLKILVPCIKLTSLEILDLEGCSRLKRFPEVLEKMEKIIEINLDATAIGKLPFSIGNLVGLERLSLKGCRGLNQLPGSIYILPKVEVLMGNGHGGFCVFIGHGEKEKMSSEVSSDVMVVYHEAEARYVLDVYYPHMSPDNVIQVCSPDPQVYHEFNLLFTKLAYHRDLNSRCKKTSTCFSFRKKFPKIALCCHVVPHVKSLVLLEFMFSVLVNGRKQFDSACTYVTNGLWWQTFWCDLKCEVEGAFSENKWNHVEILCEAKYPRPSSELAMATETWVGTGLSLSWTLVGIYKEGNNKEDIKFENGVSQFPSAIRKPVYPLLPSCFYSSPPLYPPLPCCFYYTVVQNEVTDK